MQQSRHRLCSTTKKEEENGPKCSHKSSTETRLCPCSDNAITKDPELKVFKTGKWSKWGEWSECDETSCTQSRHRKCVNKKAENEVLESMSCENGSPLDFRDCRVCGNQIILGDLEHKSVDAGKTSSISTIFRDFLKNAEETAVVWYVSFGIMCAVLVTVVIFVILWCLKRRDKNGKCSSTEQPDKQTEFNGTVPAKNFIRAEVLNHNNRHHFNLTNPNLVQSLDNGTFCHARPMFQPMYQQITNQCLQEENYGLHRNFVQQNNNSPNNTQSSGGGVNPEVLNHDLQRQALLYRNIN